MYIVSKHAPMLHLYPSNSVTESTIEITPPTQPQHFQVGKIHPMYGIYFHPSGQGK